MPSNTILAPDLISNQIGVIGGAGWVVDRNSPLAAGLVLLVIGGRDIVSGQQVVFTAGDFLTSVDVKSSRGKRALALRQPGSGTANRKMGLGAASSSGPRHSLLLRDNILSIKNKFTMAWLGALEGTPDNYGALFSIRRNLGGWTGDVNCLTMGRYGTVDGPYVGYSTGFQAGSYFTKGGTWKWDGTGGPNAVKSLIFARDGATQTWYKNGALDTTTETAISGSTGTTNVNFDSNNFNSPGIMISDYGWGSTGRLFGTTNVIAVWNRALSYQEATSFDRDPYQLVKSSRPIIISNVVALDTAYPDAVALTVATPTPTITVNSTVSPSTVTATATVQTPVARDEITVSPSTVTTTAAVGSVTGLNTTINAPVVTLTADVRPPGHQTLRLYATVHAPTVGSGGTMPSPSSVTATATVQTVDLQISSTASPSTVTATAAVQTPSPTVIYNYVAVGSPVQALARVKNPVIGGDAIELGQKAVDVVTRPVALSDVAEAEVRNVRSPDRVR